LVKKKKKDKELRDKLKQKLKEAGGIGIAALGGTLGAALPTGYAIGVGLGATFPQPGESNPEAIKKILASGKGKRVTVEGGKFGRASPGFGSEKEWEPIIDMLRKGNPDLINAESKVGKHTFPNNYAIPKGLVYKGEYGDLLTFKKGALPSMVAHELEHTQKAKNPITRLAKRLYAGELDKGKMPILGPHQLRGVNKYGIPAVSLAGALGGGKDTYLDDAAILGTAGLYVPTLIEEGRANLGAHKRLKRLGIKGGRRGLIGSMATYVSPVAGIIGAGYGASYLSKKIRKYLDTKQKDKKLIKVK